MAESQETQEAPQEPTKISPQEFEEKLQKGEISLDSDDPGKLIQEMVEIPEEVSRETQEPVLAQPEEAPKEAEPTPSEPPKDEVKPEPKFYQKIGDLLKDAKEAGLQFENAADMIQKIKVLKEDTAKKETAVSQWSNDATKSAAEIKRLQDQIEKQKELLEQAQRAPAPKPTEAPVQEEQYTEPEIPRPDELADPAQWADYTSKVAERSQRITEKRFEAQLKREREDRQKERQEFEQKQQQSKAEWEKQERERQQREAAARTQEEAMIAAEDFVKVNREFDFGDGKSVKEKNTEYLDFLQRVEYIKDRNPVLKNRDLAADYFNGVQDAVQAVDNYGITPPQGAKQFALLVELDKLAATHNLRSDSGRPDYKAAYAIKKQRDGVDTDELNRARASGAEEVIEVVQARQRSTQQIGAQDVVADDTPQRVSVEGLEMKMKDFQAKAATMSDSERQKARVEIDADCKALGIEPLVREQQT